MKITNGRQAGQGTYGNFHVIVRLNTRAEGKKLDPSVRASAKYNHEDGDAFTSRFPVMSSNDPALSLNLACKSRCLRATFISRARARAYATAAAATELEHYTEMRRNSRTLFLSAAE